MNWVVIQFSGGSMACTTDSSFSGGSRARANPAAPQLPCKLRWTSARTKARCRRSRQYQLTHLLWTSNPISKINAFPFQNFCGILTNSWPIYRGKPNLENKLMMYRDVENLFFRRLGNGEVSICWVHWVRLFQGTTRRTKCMVEYEMTQERFNERRFASVQIRTTLFPPRLSSTHGWMELPKPKKEL
jgi:hypothetical protein